MGNGIYCYHNHNLYLYIPFTLLQGHVPSVILGGILTSFWNLGVAMNPQHPRLNCITAVSTYIMAFSLCVCFHTTFSSS